MQYLKAISPIVESFAHTPWKLEDVEFLVSHLRDLRAGLIIDSSTMEGKEPSMSHMECAQILSTLASHFEFLFNCASMRHLDETNGRDHLVITVLIQCLVNCLSVMGHYKYPISGEIAATLITSLIYNQTNRNWIFSLKLMPASLPLWRTRIGCYTFVLLTSLITSVQQTGIPPDFTKFLHLAVLCMKVIHVNGSENMELINTWSDHCIILISALCASPPSEVYWLHEVHAQERVIELSSALGTILLLHDYEGLGGQIEAPSMKKLAELCLKSCHSMIQSSRDLWIDTLLAILQYCVTRSPFQVYHEVESDKPVLDNLILRIITNTDALEMLGILRGAVHLVFHLLPPIEDKTDSLQRGPLTPDEARFTALIFIIGDLLVILDSLLQFHLATCESLGTRRKAPSLMDSMGVFSFHQPRSICFAMDLKQELIRCLLAILHSQPHLVPRVVEHARVVEIKCPSTGSDVPVNARDIFWALMNATQRDPDFIPILRTKVILSQGYRLLCSAKVTTPQISQLLDNSHLCRLLDKPGTSATFEQILKLAPDFDNAIIKPLIEVAKLNTTTLIELLKVAVSPELERLYYSGSSCTVETRLSLLQPSFVNSQIVNPLMRFGVKNPHRVIRRCPRLFNAAIIKEGDETRLQAALNTLNGLLTRKDLGDVVKNFPIVLTRSRSDLEATYDYLTHVMGLESSREVVRTMGRRSAHEMRHSTRLNLIACPAWQLPLRLTVARHTLLLLANQWPPSLPNSSHKSRDYIVGKLLTCPPEQFAFWLEYHDQSEDTMTAAAEEGKASFSAADVRHFEKICENLNPDGTTTTADSLHEDEGNYSDTESDVGDDDD